MSMLSLIGPETEDQRLFEELGNDVLIFETGESQEFMALKKIYFSAVICMAMPS